MMAPLKNGSSLLGPGPLHRVISARERVRWPPATLPSCLRPRARMREPAYQTGPGVTNTFSNGLRESANIERRLSRLNTY